MNQKRLDKLIQLTNKDYGIYELSLDENGEPEVFSCRSNTFLKRSFNKTLYVFTLWDLDKINWQYSSLEIKLYLQGYDLLNKSVSEYIPVKKKPYKKQHDYTNKCTSTCVCCELKYPKKEMMGDTCYICAEENNKSKAI